VASDRTPPITLPGLLGPYLEQIELCGAFDIEDDELAEWLTKLAFFHGVAPYTVGESDAWLLCTLDKFDECVAHVHIEIAKPTFFGLSPPKATTELEKVFEHLSRLAGLSGSAQFDARFTIPLDDLPPGGIIMALTGVETSAGPVGLTLSGATMDVDGDDHVRTIRWAMRAKSNDVCADVMGMIEQVNLTEDYLNDAIAIVSEAAERLLFEEDYEEGSSL
jgi:hypothetical protein